MLMAFFNLNKFLISLIMERSFYGMPVIFYDVTDVFSSN